VAVLITQITSNLDYDGFRVMTIMMHPGNLVAGFEASLSITVHARPLCALRALINGFNHVLDFSLGS